MDEVFSVQQRRTRSSNRNETTARSKDILTFFNKEINVIACAFAEKKIIVIDEFINLYY